MRNAVILGLIGACLATSAGAQSTVTTCGEEFGKWVCRSETQQPAPSAFEAGQKAYRDAYRRPIPPPPSSDVRDDVAQAVREGRCDDARQIAMGAGDGDLASAVGRVCRPN